MSETTGPEPLTMRENYCGSTPDRLQTTTGDLEISIDLPPRVRLRDHPKVPATVRNMTSRTESDSDHEWLLLWMVDGRTVAVTTQGGSAISGRALGPGESVAVSRGISRTISCADHRSLPGVGTYQVYYLHFLSDQREWEAFRATNPPDDSEDAPMPKLAAVAGPYRVEMVE